MKKIPIFDAKKINDYIGSVSLERLHVGNLIATVNSGKNHYNVTDVLSFLINSIHKDLTEQKTITNNKLSKYIFAIKEILKAYNSKSIYVGDELFSKMQELKNLTINNPNVTGKQEDNILDELLNSFEKELQNNFEFKSKEKEIEKTELEDNNVSVTSGNIQTIEEYDSIIKNLQKRIASLEAEATNYAAEIKTKTTQELKNSKEIEKQQKKIEKLKEMVVELRKLKKEADKQCETSEKKTSKLSKKLESCSAKITELSATVESLILEKETLLSQIQSAQSTITSLQDTVTNQCQELETTRLALEGYTVKRDLLDNFIMDQLFTKNMSVSEILELLLANGFDVSRSEVLESLRRINERVNVRTKNSFEKEYGIVAPSVRTNVKINYPDDKRSFDVVLLADYHYDGSSGGGVYLQSKFDAVYDYCIVNNINNIITLGDLLDNRNVPMGISRENYDIVRKFIEDFQRILPQDDDVKHFVLGGNHDQAFLQYGIDPIEELCFDREDLISLGYSDAYLYFAGADVIGLHHEGVPRESAVPDLYRSGKETINNLRRSYDNARVAFAERYFDFLGHFHKSRLDITNAFGVVPSLCVDRNNDGAWHLKIELDNNGRINNIIIKNLIFNKNRDLRSINEIIYQRTKNKPN